MATVIRIILTFFETYPDKTVFFTGSTPSRTRLYQIILKREYESLSQEFIIEGVKQEMIENLQIDKNYEAFLIRVKTDRQ